MNLQTLKGFRDFLPNQTRKRQYVIDILKKTFESYGFEPLETPALEYEELLTGKYGDESEKLLYKFTDNGKRNVAMRYDQTVPLARIISQYQNELPLPFKRYQIGNVWRAENTQKGRYREFTQCDIDIVGSSSPLSDAEIIITAVTGYNHLGFKNIKVLINDRNVFLGLPKKAVTIIDKLKKIGEEKVIQELVGNQITTSTDEARQILNSLIKKEPTTYLNEVMLTAEKLGVKKDSIEYSPTLARGLDYYTGMILEIESNDYLNGSLAGGGRYDNLIGLFSGKQIPSVGLAFGFDRTLEAMEALSLFPENLKTTKVLVTIFSKELAIKSLELSSKLRAKKVNVELYLDENAKMEKQLKYANQKSIPYVIILGPDEISNQTITLKNMQTGEQKTVSQTSVIDSIQ